MYNQQVVDNIVTLATIPEIGQNERLMIATALLNNLQLLPGQWTRMGPNPPVNGETKAQLIRLMQQHDNIPDAVLQQLPQTKRTMDNVYETFYVNGAVGQERKKLKHAVFAQAYGGDVGWEEPVPGFAPAPMPQPGRVAADWLDRAHRERQRVVENELEHQQREPNRPVAVEPRIGPPAWLVLDDMQDLGAGQVEAQMIAQQQVRAEQQRLNQEAARQLRAAAEPMPPEYEDPF